MTTSIHRAPTGPFAQSLPSAGQKLPAFLRPYLETVFGATFEDVRIHCCAASKVLGARAFAYGNKIYFAPGVYDPATDAGLFCLGHELAHVVQQRLGRVPCRHDGEIVIDAALEEEANQAAQRLVEACRADSCVAPGIMQSLPEFDPASPRAVQCMLSVDEFKSKSKAAGPRNRIKSVDRALADYQQTLSTKPQNWAAILQKAKAVTTACKAYTQSRPNSGRQAGVDIVLRQAAAEEAILFSLAEFQKATDLGDKFDKMQDAYEILLKFRDRIHRDPRRAPDGRLIVPNIEDYMSTAKIALIDAIKKDNPAATRVVLDDTEELKNIAADDGTPGLVRSIILEATAAVNLQQLDFAFNSPSAKYNVTRGLKAKYTVSHQLSQGEGRKFRLGSLLHELTHVSIAETFGNSIIMLACPVSWSDTQMLKLANQRKANIMNLLSTVENVPIAPLDESLRSGALYPNQKKELTDKLGYVLDSNQTDKYLSLLRNFDQVKTVGKAEKDVQVAMADRIASLKQQGMRNELTEYDTVINQTLLWCHLWRLDPTHPVYQSLMASAQTAYSYRASHRGASKMVISPLTQAKIQRTHGRRMSIG